MQRHNKPLNHNEKELYNRAITDINFNVPRATVASNLEIAPSTKSKQTGAKKHRDNSQGVPVGLKGLAAIAQMRSSKNS